MEERKSLVILRYFHPWPDLSAQYIPGICLYVEEFYVPNFISFHKPTHCSFSSCHHPCPKSKLSASLFLAPHIQCPAKSYQFYLNSLSHLFLLTGIISVASQLPWPLLTPAYLYPMLDSSYWNSSDYGPMYVFYLPC